MKPINYPGDNRRSDDVITGLLSQRIDAVSNMVQDTNSELSKHVSSCETMQKRVLVVVTGLLVWEVATKPEVLKLLGGIVGILLK